jgi:hypothetical protein
VTSEAAERVEILGRRPLGDRRELMRADILANIVRNFSRQPVKESALDLLDRAASLRKGTIKAVQTSLHSMESRSIAERRSMTLGARFTRNRINRVIEEHLPGLVHRLAGQRSTLLRVVDASLRMIERLADITKPRAPERQSVPEFWQTAQSVEEHLPVSSKRRTANEIADKRGRTR